MMKSLRPWCVDENWFLPPSVHEFVPARHPAHPIRDIVREELDLSAILSTYTEARGLPPSTTSPRGWLNNAVVPLGLEHELP